MGKIFCPTAAPWFSDECHILVNSYIHSCLYQECLAISKNMTLQKTVGQPLVKKRPSLGETFSSKGAENGKDFYPTNVPRFSEECHILVNSYTLLFKLFS